MSFKVGDVVCSKFVKSNYLRRGVVLEVVDAHPGGHPKPRPWCWVQWDNWTEDHRYRWFHGDALEHRRFSFLEKV